jgi:hypothetical protein
MMPELEDLIGEAEITIRDAYQRGFDNAKLSFDKSANTKKMLAEFGVFVFKYNLYKNLDGTKYFNVENSLLTLEELISLFLLKYDYEQD